MPACSITSSVVCPATPLAASVARTSTAWPGSRLAGPSARITRTLGAPGVVSSAQTVPFGLDGGTSDPTRTDAVSCAAGSTTKPALFNAPVTALTSRDSGETIRTEVAALVGSLQALDGTWQGQASAAFAGVLTQWRSAQAQVEAALTSLTQALSAAATGYADAEATAARMFAQ